MISEFYVFLAVIAVAVILMAVVIVAIFMEMRKSRHEAGEPTD